MTEFCGLCECEVEGSWEAHVESQQHQENLADPGTRGGAMVRHLIATEYRTKESEICEVRNSGLKG